MKLNRINTRLKVNLFKSIFILFSFSIFCYLFNLQVLNNTILRQEKENNIITKKPVPATRSKIFDIKNNLIVDNDVYYLIYFNNFKELLATCKEFNYINCNNPLSLTQSQFSQIEHLDIVFSREIKRKYLFYNYPHIIGYLSRITQRQLEEYNFDSIYLNNDLSGQDGIEKFYDLLFHGMNGYINILKTPGGKQLSSRFNNDFNILRIKEPIDSPDIRLNIDIRLQEFNKFDFENKIGAFIAINIKDSSILTLASYPSYDINNYKKSFNNKDKPLINRALRGYAPGSTFKIVTALAILEENLINPDKEINCPGYFNYAGRVWHCWKKHGHGKVNLRKAIKESCDTYFYMAALKIGFTNLLKYAKLLGFGQYTGIDLPNDSRGNLKNNKYAGSLLNYAIGQGDLLVSLLQLVNAYATIFRGGTIYTPRIYGDSDLINKYKFKQSSIEFIQNALWAVVNEEGGTVYLSNKNKVNAGGKTGTVQKVSLDKKNIKDNGIFIGLYPIDNPKIAVGVLMENGEHGSSVAPIVLKYMEFYGRLYN